MCVLLLSSEIICSGPLYIKSQFQIIECFLLGTWLTADKVTTSAAQPNGACLLTLNFNSQLQYVDSLIKQKMLDQERVMKQPRRTCTLPNYPKGNQDILGKVSFLSEPSNEFCWFQEVVVMEN